MSREILFCRNTKAHSVKNNLVCLLAKFGSLGSSKYTTKNVGHSPHTRKVKQMQEADENAGHCEFIVWSRVILDAAEPVT